VHRRGRGARRRHRRGGFVNVKAFFVATLSSALDLGIATPDDVLRHVSADVLSLHLPRPLWARLLTAALGAPRVDAQLVIETIGFPNLCEHIPSPIIWACIAELGARSLSGGVPVQPISRAAASTPAAMKAAPLPVAAPPPEIKREAPARETPSREAPSRGTPSRGTPSAPAAAAAAAAPAPAAAAASAAKPAEGLADVVAALESDERQATPPARARTPTGPRFRQNGTGISRLGAMSTRRPQAPAAAPDDGARAAAGATPAAGKPASRGQTEVEEAYEIEPELKDDWKSSLAVEDEQLVDLQASEETQTSADEYRKR
jgi:hypothetical protein